MLCGFTLLQMKPLDSLINSSRVPQLAKKIDSKSFFFSGKTFKSKLIRILTFSYCGTFNDK